MGVDATLYGSSQKIKELYKDMFSKVSITEFQELVYQFIDTLDIEALQQLLIMLAQKLNGEALEQLIQIFKDLGGLAGINKLGSRVNTLEFMPQAMAGNYDGLFKTTEQIVGQEKMATIIRNGLDLVAHIDTAKLKELLIKIIQNADSAIMMPFIQNFASSAVDLNKLRQLNSEMYSESGEVMIPKNNVEALVPVLKLVKVPEQIKNILQGAGTNLLRALEIAKENNNEVAVTVVEQELRERTEQLFKAIDINDIKFIKYALTQLELTVTDEQGNTPLHRAVKNNNHELVLLLLERDTNQESIGIVNKTGERPTDLAYQLLAQGKPELFEFFMKLAQD